MGAWARAAGIGVLGLALASGAAAEEEPTPPTVPLERLLELPTSVDLSSDTAVRGGATRAQWQARFAQAQQRLEEARAALEEARAELEKMAPDQAWSMAAPGLGTPQPSETSIDFRLRQEIRRQREEVERSERALSELRIEADLAGVPAEWQTPP